MHARGGLLRPGPDRYGDVRLRWQLRALRRQQLRHGQRQRVRRRSAAVARGPGARLALLAELGSCVGELHEAVP